MVGVADRVKRCRCGRAVPAEPITAVSAGGVAAIDGKGDADDQAGAWAAQPQHRSCDLVGAA
jgi:hypothetical protein